MELLVIAAFCTILQNSAPTQETVFSHHPPAMCKIVQNYARLPVQHHFSTIQDLHVAVLAFKPFLLSPHACGPHATPCKPVEINPGVSDPQTTPGLFECPPHHAMELPIIAAYCSILQHSAPKQEQFSLTPLPEKCKIVQNCQLSTISAPFRTSKLLSWLSSLSSCLLMLVDHMQHPATCGN